MKENTKSMKMLFNVCITITILVIGFVLSVVAYANIKLYKYSSDDEILTIAEDLGCDVGYLKKQNNHYVRMEHNGKQPIYVCFEESFNEEEINVATNSLDYIFGIVNKINTNYRYEIVSKEEYNKWNKTKILYTIGEKSAIINGQAVEANGNIQSSQNMLSVLTTKRTMNSHIICINRNQLVRENVSLAYTLNHELMHAFGFEDVYTFNGLQKTMKFQGNTLINNECSDVNMLTPNDVKCLIALYLEKDSNRLNEMKNLLAEYKDVYYDAYVKACKNKANINQGLYEDSFIFERTLDVNLLNSKNSGYSYEVQVDEGEYLFTILDKVSKTIIDSCGGKILQKDGVVVLENITLKTGLRPYEQYASYEGGFVQDLVMCQKDDKPLIYNIYNNEITTGKISLK